MNDSRPIAVVWLDRDGTIVDDPGYLDDPDKLVLLPGAAESIAMLRAAGLLVVLISNQSGIARGLMSEADVHLIHEKMQGMLRRGGGELDAIYFCPHLPPDKLLPDQKACDCRKPEPGLVLKARKDLGIAGIPEFVIGDKAADLLLAGRIGARGILVRTGEGEESLRKMGSPELESFQPDLIAQDVMIAARWILKELAISHDFI